MIENSPAGSSLKVDSAPRVSCLRSAAGQGGPAPRAQRSVISSLLRIIMEEGAPMAHAGRLAGRNAVITGAGSGIGLAIAGRFAEQVWHCSISIPRVWKLQESSSPAKDPRSRRSSAMWREKTPLPKRFAGSTTPSVVLRFSSTMRASPMSEMSRTPRKKIWTDYMPSTSRELHFAHVKVWEEC